MGYIKVVQSGSVIEVYQYEKEPPVLLSRKSSRRNRPRNPRLGFGLQTRRGDSLARAIKSFRRIVSGNLSRGAPAMLTLSMLDIVALADARKCFDAFGQKIKTLFGKDIAWVSVAEFQKRGAVHFHVLIWGLPYELPCLLGERYRDKTGKMHAKHVCPPERACERKLRVVAEKWPHGFVDLIQTDGSPRLATYLTKYMSKSMSDPRLGGTKAYTATRNLMRPVSISAPSAVDRILEDYGVSTGDNFPDRETSYGTLWLGRCIYQRYSKLSNI